MDGKRGNSQDNRFYGCAKGQMDDIFNLIEDHRKKILQSYQLIGNKSEVTARLLRIDIHRQLNTEY